MREEIHKPASSLTAHQPRFRMRFSTTSERMIGIAIVVVVAIGVFGPKTNGLRLEELAH